MNGLQELNERLIRAAETMVASIDTAYEITHKLESENASRIVWLVALSGFAIINAPNLLLGSTTPSIVGLLPWIITALAGVITHWLHRYVAIQNFSLYLTKREQLSTFIINGPANATKIDLEKILLNKTDQLGRIGRAHNRATSITTIMEVFTFVAFVTSLIFHVILVVAPVWSP